MSHKQAQRVARMAFERFKDRIEHNAATHSHEDGVHVATELVKVAIVLDHFLKSNPEYVSCRDYLIGHYEKHPQSTFNIKCSALKSEPHASVLQLAEV